jgi:glycosyltransferase involved in cell wall biosynthesis
MNILIDFIPFQHLKGVSGAASFTKAVYDELMLHTNDGINLFAVYDSSLPTDGRYDCKRLAAEWALCLADIGTQTLSAIVRQYAIDVFFLSIGQLYGRYDLTNISCKTVMFIHDIFDAERTDNLIDATIHDKLRESNWNWMKRLANIYTGRGKRIVKKKYEHIMSLFAAENTVAYTVSNYSRNSILYYFPEIRKEVKVCYSPLKTVNRSAGIENDTLREIIDSGKAYLLMISANRVEKNPSTVMKVFQRLAKEHPDLFLVTLKYGRSILPNHIDISFLTDSDLEHAYEHARVLLFPSYFEGFGYPPIEAMKYGTPVVVSNVTSIPEVVGDAGIYFSPFYPADLYRAIVASLSETPDTRKLLLRYEQVRDCQKKHLNLLIEELLSKS